MANAAPNLGGFVPGGDARTWAPEVWAELIAEEFIRGEPIATVVDVGAGEGHAAAWFLEHGLRTTAIEGHPVAAEACNVKLSHAGVGSRVIVHDFEQGPLALAKQWDLGWSSEFVEHVEERCLPNVIAVLASCRVLAMTHALPGKAGVHHVNCQPPEYWRGALAAVGMRLDLPESLRLRELTTAVFVRQTLLIFRRSNA
jgi:hypothetical protein